MDSAGGGAKVVLSFGGFIFVCLFVECLFSPFIAKFLVRGMQVGAILRLFYFILHFIYLFFEELVCPPFSSDWDKASVHAVGKGTASRGETTQGAAHLSRRTAKLISRACSHD